jgi:hypothetical protein
MIVEMRADPTGVFSIPAQFTLTTAWVGTRIMVEAAMILSVGLRVSIRFVAQKKNVQSNQLQN